MSITYHLKRVRRIFSFVLLVLQFFMCQFASMFSLYNIVLILVHIHCCRSDHYFWGQPSDPSNSKTILKPLFKTSEVGKPLILSPYIQRGDNVKAMKLSKVSPDIGGWLSYSGYLTVNEACGSNIFLWFIPAKINWRKAPLLIWLQGGPGSSSMFGLFEEIGPFNHLPSGLQSRNYTWNNENNVVYIDQPVGTGFSFSKNKCYAENMTTVTLELYSALTQFLKLFPELQPNRLFLTGESYAGHYIPPLAMYIHNNKCKTKVKINLAGYVIGNPLTKLSCHNYAEFLYTWGVVDKKLRDEINERHEMLVKHADAGQYKEANDDWYYILNNIILEKTGLPSRECMINQPPNPSDYMDYIVTPEVRKKIHVGNTDYHKINWDVYVKLLNTIAEPMTEGIEQILQLKKYTVGFYSGNLDMICLYTSTECVLSGLQWWGAEEYYNTKRQQWYDGESLLGWFKMAGPLYHVIIRDAGHSVPYYKSKVMYDLIQTIVTADPGVNPASKLNTKSG